MSPFARSVASHLRALVDGGVSREAYSREDSSWESTFERRLIEDREKKRQVRYRVIHSDHALRRDSLRSSHVPLDPQLHKDEAEPSGCSDVERLLKEPLHDSTIVMRGDMTHPESESSHDVRKDIDDAPQRKRRRNQVDYKALYEKMKKEGEM